MVRRCIALLVHRAGGVCDPRLVMYPAAGENA